MLACCSSAIVSGPGGCAAPCRGPAGSDPVLVEREALRVELADVLQDLTLQVDLAQLARLDVAPVDVGLGLDLHH